MSTIERDLYLRMSWVEATHPPSSEIGRGPHFPVQVLGIIDDARFRLNGEKEFVDIVSWWPALGKWTVTHSCRADENAVDTQVNVAWWQPMPPLKY